MLPPRLARRIAPQAAGPVSGPVSRRLIGYNYLGLIIGSNSKLFDRDIADRLRLIAASTACAIERWRLVHPGRLPGS